MFISTTSKKEGKKDKLEQFPNLFSRHFERNILNQQLGRITHPLNRRLTLTLLPTRLLLILASLREFDLQLMTLQLIPLSTTHCILRCADRAETDESESHTERLTGLFRIGSSLHAGENESGEMGEGVRERGGGRSEREIFDEEC